MFGFLVRLYTLTYPTLCDLSQTEVSLFSDNFLAVLKSNFKPIYIRLIEAGPRVYSK